MRKRSWIIAVTTVTSISFASCIALAAANVVQQKPARGASAQSMQQAALSSTALQSKPSAVLQAPASVAQPMPSSHDVTILAAATANTPIADIPPANAANAAPANQGASTPAGVANQAGTAAQAPAAPAAQQSVATKASQPNDASQGQGIVSPAINANPDLNQSFGASNQAASSLTLEQRITRLEQQVTNLINMNKPQTLAGLQNQIQQLSGQVEVLQHNLKQLNQQQRSFYKALDQRIDQMKTLRGADDSSSATDLPAADTKDAAQPGKKSTVPVNNTSKNLSPAN